MDTTMGNGQVLSPEARLSKLENQSTLTLSRDLRLVHFAQAELGVSDAEIRVALNRHQGKAYLPMVLWQYGFITLTQLDRLFAWLEQERGQSMAL